MLEKFLLDLMYNNLKELFVYFYNKKYKYYVVFKNNFIKFLEVYLLIYKLKIIIRFKKFKSYYKISKRRIHHFKSNNGEEFNNNIFRYMYIEYKIKWKLLIVDN